MRPFKEYTKHITKPGLRRSLLEVFFLFFIIILMSAAFFFMAGEELMLQNFRSGDQLKDIPAPTDRVYRLSDSAIESAVDELVKKDQSIAWLSDDIKEKYRSYFDKSELDRNIFEHYENILKLDEGDSLYIARLTPDTRNDLTKLDVSPVRFHNAFSNQPFVLMIPFLLVILALLMAARILKPIKKLTVAAEKLSMGDWRTSISVKEIDEIGILANTLEIMRTNLKDKIFELQNTAHELALELGEKNVILEKAQLLQKSFFPNHTEIGNLSLASGFMPCEHLGGDFFDILDLGGGKLLFIFGDVEGHGVIASFNTMSILTIFRLRCRENPDPVYLAEEISDMIYRGREIESRQFSATALIGLIDQNTYNMTLVNAGHPNPIIWRNAEGKVDEITIGNPLLGIQDDYKYSSTNVEFHDDDRILLYTDGVIWCEDVDKNYFGQEKLLELVSKNIDLPVEQMITVIEKDIGKFKSRHFENEDDMSLVLFKFVAEKWSYIQIPPLTKDTAIQEVIENLETLGIKNDIISDFRLAMDELISNAVAHGNQDDLSKTVFIKYMYNHGEIRMQVRDEGDGFERDSSTFLLDREQIYEPGRRGIYLVKSIMDELFYNEKGNEVTITKKTDNGDNW